jgi:hypothetical protein
LMSSAVTQRGKFPRKTVKLILKGFLLRSGGNFEEELHEGNIIVA